MVHAVRIGERADAYLDSELYPQALALYRQAEAVCPEAYCIHARIGKVLADEGNAAESRQECRRAFELMPDSMGAVSGFCWSCRDTLDEPSLLPVALDVFEGLAKKTPDKASVHYLLGLMLVRNGNPEAALASFQDAVRLDPRYLNAWLEIVKLGDEGVLGETEAEQAAWAVLRLGPRDTQSRFNPDRMIHDKAALWRFYDSELACLPPLPHRPLYPLHGRVPTPSYGSAPPVPDAWTKRPSASVRVMDDPMIKDLLSLKA